MTAAAAVPAATAAAVPGLEVVGVFGLVVIFFFFLTALPVGSGVVGTLPADNDCGVAGDEVPWSAVAPAAAAAPATFFLVGEVPFFRFFLGDGALGMLSPVGLTMSADGSGLRVPCVVVSSLLVSPANEALVRPSDVTTDDGDAAGGLVADVDTNAG